MPRSYLEVVEELRRGIEAGEYGSERPLPAERILAETYGVHRATVRRAFVALEEEGLLRRSPGGRPTPASRPTLREGTIALYAAEEDVYSRSLIATGLAEGLRKRNPALRVVWADDDEFGPDEPHSPGMADHAGMVLWPQALIDVEHLRALARQMPTVVVDAPVGGFESDFVGFDDEGAGAEAARHLLEAGHTRFAFVGEVRVLTARYRRRGFSRFLRERGVEPVRGLEALVHADGLAPSIRRSYFDELAQSPIALLCENDETAAMLIPLLQAHGLRTPNDVALVGFGGAHQVLLDALGLTTMAQPFVDVGRHAARLLVRRLAGDLVSPPDTVRLRMTLQVRASSLRV